MAVTHRHFEMIVLDEKGDKIHVIVRNGRLSYLNQYFREDMVVLMRNFNVIPNTESYKFTNHPYKISFDRFSFARRSNTFNGDVNNTGFEVTKFCVIRSLNLDTDLPIDVTGEVISWEYELREYEVYGSKVKVLPIKLKDAVYVVDLKSEKMLDYIISYEVKDKFLVNVENARVFDDGKDPPMIYINYQTRTSLI
ncbi:replication protein A 70 kDa DNA-binding subunit D [Tanacetum coccineum]